MITVKSASGKPCGVIELCADHITITSDTKPELIIGDEELIRSINSKDYECIPQLLDRYELTIGEIAALFSVSYQTMYKRMKCCGINTSGRNGRRSSSFGTHFSTERKKNISNGNRGKTVHPVEYERTPEIRQKISTSLKEKYRSGEITVNSKGISDAWAAGKYSKAKMGRGIQGYFYSKKTTRKNGYIYFRSLLELCFLIKEEESMDVVSIINEPVHIKLHGGGIYIPDFLVNDACLIELKPKNHLLWTKDSNGRFNEEMSAAVSFCEKRGWSFMVVHDDDLGFETGAFKKFLRNNPDLISKYKIRFNDPDRLAGR